MKPEPFTFDEFLDHGAEPLRWSPPDRKAGGQAIPRVVYDRLAANPSVADVKTWSEHAIGSHWPALLEEQAGSTQHGWLDLVAGFAVGLELLAGELPPEVGKHLEEHPVLLERFRELRAPYQRFALLVGADARPERVILRWHGPAGTAGRLQVRPDLEDDPHVHWWMPSRGSVTGRSHTLTLALMVLQARGECRLPSGCPIGCTGEIKADGSSIGSVGTVQPKRREWLRRYPEGLFVSAPLSLKDAEQWVHHFGPAGESTNLPLPSDPAWDRWIVAGTLEEARAKLHDWDAARGDGGRVEAWDGRRLAADQIVPLDLTWETRPEGLADLVRDDVIHDACWHLVRAAAAGAPSAPRGLLITGDPGSGKSLLAAVIARRFVSGPLGALGVAVRRRARDLADDLEGSANAGLPSVLATREPAREALFASALEQRRLFLILDGLDEVSPNVQVTVGRLLRHSGVFFVVTARSTATCLEDLPPHHRIRIRDLSAERAQLLLRNLGRQDLAVQLFAPNGRRMRPFGARDPLAEIARTALHLSVLARVVQLNETVADLPLDDLYRRWFDCLLDQALREERLRAGQADRLRRLAPALIGTLALEWLRSGRLTQPTVQSTLDSLDLRGQEATETRHALEFGHVLHPDDGGWDFSHRTLAEWAAAQALALKVTASVARLEAPTPDQERHAELRLLGLLMGEGPAHTSGLRLVLEFYAPHARQPLALLEWVLGPSALASCRAPIEIEQALDFALTLAAAASWRQRDAGQTAWALFVRSAQPWPAMDPGGLSSAMDDDGDERRRRHRFVEGIVPYLPQDLSGLIEAAALTVDQRARLAADPTLLLRFFPPSCARCLEPVVATGTAGQRAAVLEWCAEWHQAVSPESWDKLARTLPSELRRAEQVSGMGGEVMLAQVAATRRLETALYAAAPATGHELPPEVVQDRLLEWPLHLRDALVAWFCAVPSHEGGPTTEMMIRHRRNALSRLLTECASAEHAASDWVCRLAASEHTDGAAAALYERLDASDSTELWRLAQQVARRSGVRLGRDRRSASAAMVDDDLVAKAASALRGWCDVRQRCETLLGALRDTEHFEAVTDILWRLLPPKSDERCALLEALHGAGRYPACVGVQDLLDRLEPGEDSIPWQYHDRARLHPSHVEGWRRLALSGRGRARFLALRWQAHYDELPLDDLLRPVASDSDPELRGLALDFLGRHGPSSSRPMAERPTPAAMPSDMPLSHRAFLDAPGWRDDLLAALTPDEPSNLEELLVLVGKYQVREALPQLVKRLASPRDRLLRDTVAVLLGEENRDAIRRMCGIYGAEVPESVLQLITLDELPLILAGEHAPYDHRSLLSHIARLGPMIQPALREALTRHRGALEATRDANERYPHEGWLALLADGLVATMPVDASLSCLVELAFEAFGGDAHAVWSVPGPLGSDFDEPGDRDYSSTLHNEGALRSLGARLQARARAHGEEAPALERLLEHPSETLQLVAFEELARRTEPHAVAALATRALEAHFRCRQTSWTGELPGLALASVSGGSGSVNVNLPETGMTLARAVRGHLTSAHRGLLADLLRHPRAELRAHACDWVGELGVAEWMPLLSPALDDPDSMVSIRAILAWERLDLSGIDAALARCTRRNWSAAHYDVWLCWAARRVQRNDGARPEAGGLCREAVDAFSVMTGENVAAMRSLVEVPTRLETVVAAMDPAAVPSDWLLERAQAGPEQLRAALVRLLATRQESRLAASLTPRLVTGHPLERLSAAEALMALGRVDLLADISTVWALAFGDYTAPAAWRCGEVYYLREDRLAWALRRAPVAFGPLLAHLIAHVPEDEEDRTLTERGEWLLSTAVKLVRRWGQEGRRVLLDLLDRQHADVASNAREILNRLGPPSDDLLAELRVRAQTSASAADYLAELETLTPESRVAQLRAWLTAEVLPPHWR